MSIQVYLLSFVLLCIIVLIISAITTFKITKKEFYDKIKLDIELEKMEELEEKISCFIIDNNIKVETSVERIAKIAQTLNVKQGGIECGIQCQAYLKKDDNTGENLVMFKEEYPEKVKNFLFAHEIGHILNGDSIPVTRPDGHNKSQEEQLADYTAAALLMPIESVFDFLTKNNYNESSSKKRRKLVRQLCKDYKVTEIIVLRRIKEIYTLKQKQLISI